MGEHDDKVFMKRFSGIIAGLVIVTILIIIISVGNDRGDEDNNPSRAKLAAERVAPVAGVRTELPSPVAKPVTAVVANEVVLAPSEPSGSSAGKPVAETAAAGPGEIDAAGIYAKACAACHVAGVAGAPVPGSDLWTERAAKGIDALTAAAIAGVGPIMQPKGGHAYLSDAEIRAVIEHMNSQ